MYAYIDVNPEEIKENIQEIKKNLEGTILLLVEL